MIIAIHKLFEIQKETICEVIKVIYTIKVQLMVNDSVIILPAERNHFPSKKKWFDLYSSIWSIWVCI